MDSSASVHAKAAELGKHVVRMTTASGSGHPSSALSLAHIVTHLMYKKMRWRPADPWDPNADRLVLSAGHAVPIVYAAYADLGGTVSRDRSRSDPRPLTTDELEQLRTRDSVLDGHPNPAEGIPFFDAATGSLGQGLSVAAGLALAARLDGTDRRIYTIIGDGESREGQVSEALDFIADHRLHNVCAIFSCNGQGQAGNVSQQQSPERIAAKLQAFGWDVRTIDGHDPAAIAEALDAVGTGEQPLAIVARTVKGWGVDTLQKGNWHGKPVKPQDLPAAEQSLDKAVAQYADASTNLSGPAAPSGTPSAARHPRPDGVNWPSFAQALESAGFSTALHKKALATRRAYGAALKAAAELLPQVVSLDGDVSNSTYSNLFAATHPERFIECKIAEQNMVSVAAGLSAAGYIPFVNTFAKFIARALDQVEMANISRANIKLVGSHSGVSLASDGPSQMGLLDVAFFRSFTTVKADDRESPLCWCFHPADAIAAFHCTRLMIELDGMCYMRTHRPNVPFIYAPDTTFEPGGFHELASGGDLALITAGYMVHPVREVLELLAKQNVRAALIDAYSLPIDAERLTETLRKSGGRALVIEDNYGSGLGSAVAEIAAAHGGLRVDTLCVRRIPKSTRSAAETLDYCGIAPTQIADHATALLNRP